MNDTEQSRKNKPLDSDIIPSFLKDRTDGENIIISGRKKYLLSETQFSGIHNAMNILSVTLVTNVLKICSKRTREYLKNISRIGPSSRTSDYKK